MTNQEFAERVIAAIKKRRERTSPTFSKGLMAAVEVVRAEAGKVAEQGQDNSIAALIHYPACWDTAAYPTLESALYEVGAWAGCATCSSGLRHNCGAEAGKEVAEQVQEIDMYKPCNLGVGCEDAGVCYASAHGQPDKCGNPTASSGDPAK